MPDEACRKGLCLPPPRWGEVLVIKQPLQAETDRVEFVWSMEVLDVLNESAVGGLCRHQHSVRENSVTDNVTGFARLHILGRFGWGNRDTRGTIEQKAASGLSTYTEN